MRTPQQAMKDAIESGAVQAWIDGKKVQFRDYKTGRQWVTDTAERPEFLYADFVWRPAPEPKLRPWKPEEVPVGALVKTKLGSFLHMIVSVNIEEGNVQAGQNFEGDCDFLFYRCEHSTDGGKTWRPCGVMEGGE